MNAATPTRPAARDTHARVADESQASPRAAAGAATGHWTLITPFFWPQVGGVQQYLAMICRALGPANITVIGPKLRAPAEEGDHMAAYTIRRPISDRLRLVHTTGVAFRETRRRKGGVIIGVARPSSLGVVALKRLLGVPYVVCCHGKELVADSQTRRWSNRLLLRHADCVIANSAFTSGLAIRNGAHPAAVRLLRPAIQAPPEDPDLDALRHDLSQRYGLQDKRVILTVGRLVARKGHARVLDSLRELMREHDDVRYVIVGDGPERGRLEQVTREYGLVDVVRFAGRVSDRELRAWYGLADIFVMVARTDERDIEGFGIVYLEAAMAGKPVIAGRGGGVGDAMIEGVTGLLVDPANTHELTAALRRLLDHPDEAQAMGSAGRDWVAREASEERFMAQTREILTSIGQRRAPTRQILQRLPVIRRLRRRGRRRDFVSSTDYWIQRYADGRSSGVGSYGRFAEFKAQVLNDFVERHDITSVIEFGCGDGNQLLLARYPVYAGYDVSADAIARCRQLFASDASKSFGLLDDYRGDPAELSLSLDVIYHLVEDDVFHAYMETLFDAAERFVIIYSSNTDEYVSDSPHVRHRRFTNWIDAQRPEWELVDHIPNPYPYTGDHNTGSFSDFYVFQKRDAA